MSLKDKKPLELVKCKGIYPYEWVDSFNKFKWNCLPDKERFYSGLEDCKITDEEYNRALSVWNAFNMKTFGEYHDLYLKCDVLLLCDIFEKIIDTCLEYYKLDPCHYFSSPGLA